MLNLSQQTGGTLPSIDRTFLNDAIAANKTITPSNGAGSGTNSGAAGDNAGSGINSGAGGGIAAQASGNGVPVRAEQPSPAETATSTATTWKNPSGLSASSGGC